MLVYGDVIDDYDDDDDDDDMKLTTNAKLFIQVYMYYGLLECLRLYRLLKTAQRLMSMVVVQLVHH